MNFIKYIDKFIFEMNSTKNLSMRTVKAYSYDLTHFINYLNNNLIIKITSSVIIEYVQYLKTKYKDTTISRKIITLKMYFNYLEIKNGYKSPFKNLKFKFKKEKRLPKTLTISEVKNLLSYLENANLKANTKFKKFEISRDLALIDLLISSGIRIGEASNITLNDIIHADRVILIHGKGNKQRLIYISCNKTWTNLKNWLRLRNIYNYHDNHLFVNRYGNKLSIYSIDNLFKKYKKIVNINTQATPHFIRHTFATNLLSNGADLRSVQEILGHSNISTTEIYTEVTNDRKKKVLKKYNLRNKI